MRFKTNNKQDTLYDLMKISEGSKRKIAANLHDTTLQNMAVLVHQLELIKMYIDTDPVQAKLELADILKKLFDEIEDVRSHINYLRPMVFDDLSLKRTVEQKINSRVNTSSIKYSCSIEDVEFEDNDDKIMLYRIIQEIVHNSEKHSKCSAIDICLYTEDNIVKLDVKDDGVGFDTSVRYENNGEHFGLASLKDRVDLLNGNINIDSVIGEGTKVHIEIPYYD